VRQKECWLKSDLNGPFFTGLMPHRDGYGDANPAKTVPTGAAFPFDDFCRAASW
jgi:hypothetical protein